MRENIRKRRFLVERVVDFFLYYCLTDLVIYYEKIFGFPGCLEGMSSVDKMKTALPAAVMVRRKLGISVKSGGIVGC